MATRFIDTPANIMDDSGRSAQPFFIEGDSFLLEVLVEKDLDLTHSGQLLHLLYVLEQRIVRITEGHRASYFIFFDYIAATWKSSPFLMFLRNLMKAYIKHVLRIPVGSFASPTSEFVEYTLEASPICLLIGDGRLTEAQAARVQTLASFGSATGAAALPLDTLPALYTSLLEDIFRKEIRCVRMAELIAADGMLRGLVVTLPDGEELQGTFEAIPASEAASRASAAADAFPAAGAASVAAYDAAAKSLTAAKVFTPRLAAAVTAAAALLTSSAASSAAAAGHAALLLLHALVLQDLPLSQRAQPDELVDVPASAPAAATAAAAALRTSALAMYASLSPLAAALAAAPEGDAVAGPLALALQDAVDGRLWHRMLIKVLDGTLDAASVASSPAATALWAAATAAAKAIAPSASVPASASAAITALGGKVLPAPVTALPRAVADTPTAADATGSGAAASVQLLAAAWRGLPPVDPQILRILLDAASDGSPEAAAAIAAAEAKAAAVAKGADESEAAVPETAATAATAAAPEEAGGDWEEEAADDWEAEAADDWEDEAEAAPATTDAAAAVTTDAAAAPAAAAGGSATSFATKGAPGAVNIDTLLGGPLEFVGEDDDEEIFWDTTMTLPDGVTMKQGFKETHLAPNPVSVGRDTKNMMFKLLDKHRKQDPDVAKSYVMPPMEEIKHCVRFASRELTMDRAILWFKSAIDIKVRRALARAATRSDQTKNEYVKSMKTPSKIILRDVVATQGADEESSDDDADAYVSAAAAAAATAGAAGKGKGAAKSGNNAAAATAAAAASKSNKAGNAKKAAGGAKDTGKLSVAERVALEVQQKHAAEALTEVDRFIATLNKSRLTLNEKIDRLDEKLLAHAEKVSALHGLLELMRWRIAQWKDRVENRPKNVGATSSAASAASDAFYEVAVRLTQLLNDLARRFLNVMTTAQLEEVMRAFALIGFSDSAQDLAQSYFEANPDADASEAVRLVSLFEPGRAQSTAERRFHVGMSRARFQLMYGGHALIRNVKSAKDPRVSGFYPDRWQRKLLDIVDRNESALVVAPTSAGKTLVSFYTVEQVARMNRLVKTGSQRGIVVFLAPTMALARQIESDVIMRSAATVCVHDTYVQLPAAMNFDVLVTLPSCMENILLSPVRAPWVSRIKYVVFDEVHSIGTTLAGPTWERIFLLISQTPFLALSATVGGADRFHNWLKYMRADSSTNSLGKVTVGGLSLPTLTPPSPAVHKVVTSIRWGHLHHYFYVPPLTFLDSAIAEVGSPAVAAPLKEAGYVEQEVGAFVPLHPCGTVAFESAERRKDVSLLSNVEFSSSDLLQVYTVMTEVAAKSPRFNPPAGQAVAENVAALAARLKELDPDVYFGFKMEKLHVLEYEEALKAELHKWHDAVLDTEVLEIVDTLGKDLRDILEPLTAATRARRAKWMDQILPMLRQLRDRDWFPAIIFCLDRAFCTEICVRLVEELEAEELAQWQAENNPRLDTKARERELEKQMKAARRARDTKSAGSAEASKEKEELEKMGFIEAEVSGPSARELDPLAWGHKLPDDRFSFVTETDRMPVEEISYWERRARRRRNASAGLDGTHPLIRGLYRGFGCHSLGVERTYRDLVEVMFRQRNLKFVIATETLGLGVNMPCRTAVFAFTTVELNPLNYRQMSGRAGRRGFDDKGQVVFFGVDPRAACRLMTSSLTELRGHFHLSATSVLRVLIKHHFLRDANANKQSQNIALLDQDNLIYRSFYAYTQQYPEHTRLTLIHHFRYCVAYFQQLRLFPDGSPSGIAFLMSMLATAGGGDGAFTLAYLLRCGAIDRLCESFEQDEDTLRDKSDASSKLMMLLCHIFHPMVLRHNARRSDYSASSPSVVLLPPLTEVSADVAAAHAAHEALVLRVFSRYCAAVSASTAAKVTVVRGASSAAAAAGAAEAAAASAAAAEEAVRETLKQAYQLPLSAAQPAAISPEEAKEQAVGEDDAAVSALVADIAGSSLPAAVRSPFAALGGSEDSFSSLAELVTAVRRDASLANVQLPINTEMVSEGSVLSAYAYDFYTHGDYYDIIATHGVNKTACWDALFQMDCVLRALKKGLFKLAHGGDGDDSDDDEEEANIEAVLLAEMAKGKASQSRVKLIPEHMRVVHARTAKCFKYVFEQFHRNFKNISRGDMKKGQAR